MPGLCKLALAGCASLGNGAVGSLAAITSLEHLNLEWCSVSSKGAPLAPVHAACASRPAILYMLITFI
jgi:hypothetical protein